ncbi:hypothetical protein ACJ5XU_004260, partial [Providencia stuartii]
QDFLIKKLPIKIALSVIFKRKSTFPRKKKRCADLSLSRTDDNNKVNKKLHCKTLSVLKLLLG